MAVTIRLPDGREIDIATDDPKLAAAAARKHWERTQVGPVPTPKPNTFRAAIGNVVDNVLPNWGDEVAGAARLIGAYTGSGRDPKTAFAEGQREFLEEQKAYKAAHPVLSTGTALAGFGLGMAAPTGRLASGASMAAKAAHGAAVGAGYGVLSGSGEGDTIGDRGANALRSGAIGATMGAAASPLISGAVHGARAVGNTARMIPGIDGAARRLANVPRAVLGRPLAQRGDRAAAQADRMVADRMQQGHIATGMGQQGAPASPVTIANEMERRQAMGVPAIVGDITEPMRGVTSWASRGAGPGQTMVRQTLDRRKAEEAMRVRGHVQEAFGTTADPIAQVEQMAARTRAEAAPLYQAAYAEPMVLTPEIEGIMATPAFQEALPHAVRNIRNAQRDPQALGFRMDQDGDVGAMSGLSTEGFDQVIRAMRDSGRAAADVNPLTGRVVNNTNSVHINARAADLRTQLADQNPAYEDVTRRYADDMAQRDAFQNGQDVAKLSGHEVNAQARAMPEAAQGSWAIGAGTALADDASKFGVDAPTGDTAGRIRKALGDETKQEAIGRLTGNTGAVRGLQERLEAEHQGNILWREVHGNSRTAGRQALDADFDAAAAPGPSSFTVRGMTNAVIGNIAQRATAQYRNDVKARIAQIVTEENPATVRELMAAIEQRALTDQDFIGLLHRSGVIGAKAAGATIVPTPPLDTDD